MERIQDFLKPRYGSEQKTRQGAFHPNNPDKYVGNLCQIYYRSGWEFEFYKWLDDSPNVVRWSSESVQVPYINPLDKKQHRYFIDVYMEVMMGGEKIKWLIEIKPHKYTVFPKQPKKKTQSAMKNYVIDYNKTLVNIAKFKAAKYYSEQLGALFGVVSKDKKTNKFKLEEWSESAIKINEKRE